jgi:geranylgeranyl diphosphate synthase type I
MDLELELKKRSDFFNGQIEKFLRNGNPETLYDAVRHLPLAGGKRLRPCIAMLSCESVKGDVIKVIPFSIALELVHNFTLVHDDIMDKSKLRRNIPAVHIKYGEPTAIIAGDLLFAKAFESMHNLATDYSIFKNIEYGLIDCVREICEGQQLDMEYEKRKIILEDEYIEMIRKKTAIFFQFAAEVGAILGGGTPEQIHTMNEYGLNLGLGFQIWDDYLDISSDEKTLGKDIGNDIRNGKKTLIAIHCFNNATGNDKQILEDIFGNKSAKEQEVKQVYNLFIKLKSIDYAKNCALNYCEKAKKALDSIPDSDAKKILLELAIYAINRRK